MRWISFLIIVPSIAFAAKTKESAVKASSKTPVQDTLKESIEKAHNLSIQRDRFQASRLLVSTIKSDEKKYLNNKELMRQLEQISTVFYTDKGQQTYELAFSLRDTDPAASLARLQEALRLEPDNVTVLLALARHYLRQKECSTAQTNTNRAQEIDPYSTDVKLAIAQTYVCLDKKEDYFVLRASQDNKITSSNVYWLILEAEILYKSKQLEKVKELAGTAAKTDPKFPEAVYWQWQAAGPEDAVKEAQKYLNLCKSLSERKARNYRQEPFLCKRVVDAEALIAKPGATE
ncbi:MAG: tetratricopeptide repeat protein [Pseudobdellovibrionaceae bacterium]